MKAVYIKNFRKGFATNSSSTHSVIYRKKGEMFEDLNIFELDYYDRFDSTIAATKSAKIKYIAGDIMYNKPLLECMCAFYPEMKQYLPLIKKTIEENKYEAFGNHARGNLHFINNSDMEASIEYLRNIIDDEDIIIVGGSDEQDFVYDTTDGHEELALPYKLSYKSKSIVKNGNYWVGYGWSGKLRFKTEKGDCIPSYPELIDLKITNKCEHGCQFCYMNSTINGEHADIDELKRIINQVSSDSWGLNDRRVEFSVGGGNILLYPHLEELFKFMKEKGHIVNTTIRSSDCNIICNVERLKNIFEKYVSGIGISVNDTKDIEDIHTFKDIFKKKDVVIHMIPEYNGFAESLGIMNKLNDDKHYFSFLFLGYKTNGRGNNCNYDKLVEANLNAIFDGRHSVHIDTTFANRYKEYLEKTFDTEYTITYTEGEYSMFIDGVTCKAYKSSYQKDKPYDLFGCGGVINAFNNIRKDNGLEIYKDEYYGGKG